jgi:hypothetical protein
MSETLSEPIAICLRRDLLKICNYAAYKLTIVPPGGNERFEGIVQSSLKKGQPGAKPSIERNTVPAIHHHALTRAYQRLSFAKSRVKCSFASMSDEPVRNLVTPKGYGIRRTNRWVNVTPRLVDYRHLHS